MGEEARRSGTDFERSIAGMLTQLGYQIVLENESLKCQTQGHNKHTHGIDFLAKSVKPELSRPIASPDGLTLFSCKHSNVGDADLAEVQQTFDCVKSYEKYTEAKGSVLVTPVWVPRDFSEKFEANRNLYLWDQSKCHLYGNLARYYARHELKGAVERSLDRISSLPKLDTTVTLILDQSGVGYAGIFNYFELAVFYEGSSRFNLDALQAILEELRKSKVIPRFSLNRVLIHTTKGFTVDFSSKMGEILEKFISRTIGLVCYDSDLHDHSNPWFPQYIR